MAAFKAVGKFGHASSNCASCCLFNVRNLCLDLWVSPRKLLMLSAGFADSNPAPRKPTAALTATVREQAAQIQKVSAQLAFSKPAMQLVENIQ
jgi:hypothetical protein